MELLTFNEEHYCCVCECDSLTIAELNVHRMHEDVKEYNQKAAKTQIYAVTAFGQLKFHIEPTANSQLTEANIHFHSNPAPKSHTHTHTHTLT